MSYLLTQIVLCLLAAAILGVTLGWFFGGSLGRSRLSALEEQHAQQLQDAERKLEDARRLTRRHETALTETRLALEDKEGAFVQLRERFRSSQDELDTLKVRLAGNEYETESLKVRIREATTQLETAREQLERERERSASLSDAVEEAETGTLRAKEDFALMRQRLVAMEREVDELRSVNHSQAMELHARDAEIARLERRLSDLRDRPMATPTVSSHLKAAAETVTGPAGEGSSEADTKDDLTRIKGIGVVLQRRLNGLGYRTFRDIASLTPKEVEDLAGHLGRFSGRIQRDGWIDQARVLAEGGSAD